MPSSNSLDRFLSENNENFRDTPLQLFSGCRFPSRNRLLCVCFGLGASVEDAQDLLRQARHAPLYTRDRRDAIILYGLSHSMTLFQINDKLFTEKLDTLC